MPSRWITVRRPFDFTWPSRAITSFRDEHLGEHLVKGELADFAVANGHATEGEVDGSTRSAKGTGKRRTSRRKGTGNVADRIYGRRQPASLTWPFCRVSVVDEGPLRKGTEVRLTIHTFSKAQFDDECELLNGAVQTWGEDRVLELSPSVKAYIVWTGSQVIPDAAEADAWHGVNTFTATIG
jgi:hypothetical protein